MWCCGRWCISILGAVRSLLPPECPYILVIQLFPSHRGWIPACYCYIRNSSYLLDICLRPNFVADGSGYTLDAQIAVDFQYTSKFSVTPTEKEANGVEHSIFLYLLSVELLVKIIILF
jgi:hypothetical protein